MSKPWESPARQQAESAKYTPLQHVVVPTCDGLAVFRCRGAERQLIGIFGQPDDLAGYFVQHFGEQRRICEAERLRLESLARDPLSDLDLKDIQLDL